MVKDSKDRLATMKEDSSDSKTYFPTLDESGQGRSNLYKYILLLSITVMWISLLIVCIITLVNRTETTPVEKEKEFNMFKASSSSVGSLSY
jgi:hypothetical protein